MGVSVDLGSMMKWCYLLVYGACFLTLTSCTVGEKRSVLSVEEVEVIQSLVENDLRDADDGRYKVMTDKSYVGVSLSSLRSRGNVVFHSVDDFTVAEFIRVNQKSTQLPKELALELPVKLVEEDTVMTIFSKGGRWKEFDERFPKARGLVRISRVGFSRDKKTALIYFEWLGAGMLGFGRVHVLRLEAGKWRVTMESIGEEWNA